MDKKNPRSRKQPAGQEPDASFLEPAQAPKACQQLPQWKSVQRGVKLFRHHIANGTYPSTDAEGCRGGQGLLVPGSDSDQLLRSRWKEQRGKTRPHNGNTNCIRGVQFCLVRMHTDTLQILQKSLVSVEGYNLHF